MIEVPWLTIVAVTVVVFILGYVLGSRGMYRMVQESVNAGVQVGAKMQMEVMAAGLTSLPDNNNNETKDKMTVGFDLKGNKNV